MNERKLEKKLAEIDKKIGELKRERNVVFHQLFDKKLKEFEQK